MEPDRLLLLCRPGFEGDTAAEIQAAAGAMGFPGYCRAHADTGRVTLFPGAGTITDFTRHWRLDGAIFPRQAFLAADPVPLPDRDRVGALLAALGDRAVSELVTETPDSEAGRAWTRLARALSAPLRQGLAAAGLWQPGSDAPRLHLLLDDDGAHLGLAPAGLDDPRPGGIPRLKRPKSAPSRSFLKLEEAWQTFLDPAERDRALQSGMRAVDLGAAPGGWSWLLQRRGLEVLAVDNGPLKGEVATAEGVTHIRADGFTWRPPRPVDWLVCDMVERPQRVAALAADWFAAGRCRYAVFNLKLPMRRRYAAVEECREVIRGHLGSTPARLGIRHLYHDRDEVTAFLGPAPGQ
ncbi:MAG: 23S rRNA (cytidine(2498)-2'-O)-methyltransferase RlmM [Thiohalospira sp.]